MADHQISVNCVLEEHDRETLSQNYQQLVDQALAARHKAYAPYSGFSVGAALLLANGQFISGSNQENAAYPSGLCAERTALFYARHQNPSEPIEAIAVAVSDKSKHLPFPCGSCLQVISEFESNQENPIQIILIHPLKNKVWQANGIRNLMPYAFGKEHLAK